MVLLLDVLFENADWCTISENSRLSLLLDTPFNELIIFEICIFGGWLLNKYVNTKMRVRHENTMSSVLSSIRPIP